MTKEADEDNVEIVLWDVIDMLSPLTHTQRDLLLTKLHEARPHWFERFSPYWRKRILSGVYKPRE